MTDSDDAEKPRELFKNKSNNKEVLKRFKLVQTDSIVTGEHSKKTESPEHHKKTVLVHFDFPDEIITSIIGHLPTHNIVRMISLVSERMNHLSKDLFVGIPVNSKFPNSVLAITERTR
jgi:hypothetical protein